MSLSFDVTWYKFDPPHEEGEYTIADLVGSSKRVTKHIKQDEEKTSDLGIAKDEEEHHKLPRFDTINVSGRFNNFHHGHGRVLSLAIQLLKNDGTLILDLKRASNQEAKLEELSVREDVVKGYLDKYLLTRADCGTGINIEIRYADIPSVNWDPTIKAFVVCEEKEFMAETVGLERALIGSEIPTCLTVPLYTLPDGTPMRT